MNNNNPKTLRRLIAGVALTGFFVSFGVPIGHAYPEIDTESLHPETPRYTPDQVLNKDMPGRKASPVIEAVHNYEGFATERLYSVPAPGVHPRVLFGPEDLPRLRRQFQESTFGGDLLNQMRELAKKNLTGPDGWGAEVYEAMSSGDVEKFSKLWSDPRNPKKDGPAGHGKHPLLSALMDTAFLALIDEDQVNGKKVAAAVATYAVYLQPRVEEAITKPGQENYFLSVRNVMGDSAEFGFMYDFAQPFMTKEQADVTRNVIATVIKDRYGLGMDLPDHWVNWNYIGMGLYYPLLALAIEGEEGYDERIYNRGIDLTQNYILYGNSANGVGREGMGYHTAGMTHAAIMMIAMANRGDNIFTLDRWRKMLDTWSIYAQQPYGGEWHSSGDLGTFPPSTELVDVARFFFPDDERIAFIEQNLPDTRRLSGGSLDIRLLQILCPSDLDGEARELKAADFDLPKMLFDEERGMLFTRTGWGEDDLSLQVANRTDTTFHSHDHPDRGAFYLTALGQAWAVSNMRMTGPKYLNTVTIDGRGQGYFPTPGTWVEVTDTPLATFGVMDTKYCYDWQWQATVNLMTDEQAEREPWLEGFRENRERLLSRFPRDQWEQDPSPVVREYYEGYMAGNPRMWASESGWVLRAPHFPVEKSFRTIGMIKGPRPYVLIADDIRKDDQERLYKWRMHLPMEVEAYGIRDKDVLLGKITDKRQTSKSRHLPHYNTGRAVPQEGQPMLLVRVLQANQPTFPGFQENIAVETIEFIKHDDVHQFEGRTMGLGKRLSIPSRSDEPAFKILLFPHRHGDPLPTTEFSEDRSTLTVSWADQTDVYALSVDDSGRTHFNLERN